MSLLPSERNLPSRQTITRRRLFAASAGAAMVAGLSRSRAFAQQATPAALPPFTRDASITSWGFGVEETNPLAYSRVNAFKAAYPSIDIQIVPEFDNQKLLTGVASGDVPDLLWIDRGTLASWAARDVLLPLDDFFSQYGITEDQFYPAAIAEVKYNDQYYGLPQFMDVRALYVNNQALSDAGVDPASIDTSNWESLSDLGGQLVQKDGDTIQRWGFDTKLQAGTIYMWGQGNGGQFFDADGNPTFTDEKIVDALTWGIKAYDAQGGYGDYQSVSSTWQGDEQFARAQVAMTVYESWMLGIVGRVAPDLDFTVMGIKQHGGSDLISSTGGNAWAIPKDAGDVEAAQIFINFMNSDDTWMLGAQATKDARTQSGQLFIPSLTGKPSADQAQIDQLYEPIAKPFDDAVKLFPMILQTSQIRPISGSPVGSEINDILTDAVQSALSNDASAEDALSDANDKAKDAIEEFNS
jgi:multiple sugar transport system substrate-binding protein